MSTETYTPGHTENATDFMARRTLQSHGQFFAGQLRAGARVLDCGCGPGSITLGIAAAVSPGMVIGVDFAESQIEKARHNATAAGVQNASFQTVRAIPCLLPTLRLTASFLTPSWSIWRNHSGR